MTLVPEAAHRYHVYGLTLASDVPLPLLRPAEPGAPPDVLLRCVPPGQLPLPPRETLTPLDDPTGAQATLWRAANGDVLLTRRGADDTLLPVLCVLADGTQMHLPAPPDADALALHQTVAGLGLVAALRLRGRVCLHAAVAQVGGGAVLLVGRKGAGKSTTSAALALRGHALLSDDLAPLHVEAGGRLCVAAGFPTARLLPESQQHLQLGNPTDAAAGRGGKHYTDMAAHAPPPPQPALPVRAVYVLGAFNPQRAAPALQALSGLEKVGVLGANLVLNALAEPERWGHDTLWLAGALRAVPVQLVLRPAGLAALGAVCDLLLAHAHSVGGGG